jgi:hypothetical protein
MAGGPMTDYIAELDEKQNVAAVWVKEKLARGPSVFDPRKHIFDPNRNSVFIGASEEKIMSWIAGIDRQGRMSR